MGRLLAIKARYSAILKTSLLFMIILLAGFNARASHIVGGEIAVTYNGTPNSFHLKLNFYRDCSLSTNAPFDSYVDIGIYDLVTKANVSCTRITGFTVTSLTLGNNCYSPSGLCVERGTYETDITLANNSNGYYVTYNRCCRNAGVTNVSNPGATGNTWYAEIPDPSLHNSTPVFSTYPAAYWCAGAINISDLSAADADGDSLIYSLVDPLNGQLVNGGGTLDNCPDNAALGPISWTSGYSSSAMLGATATFYINAANGFVTVNSSTLGLFVVSVCVKEYRKSDGKYLGQVRRDVQYTVMDCGTPPTTAYPDTTVCSAGSTVQMNATGGTTYSWSPGTGLSNTNIANPTASPTSSITYTVTVTNSSGCTATTTVGITISSTPTITASNATICNGNSTSLSVGGASTYLWNPATGLSSSTGSPVTANPSSTTTYTVTGTNGYGCTSTKSVTVTVNPSPTAGVAGVTGPICGGTFDTFNGTGGGTYSWSPGGSTSSSITTSNSGTYTVTVTNASGCTATATATISLGSATAGVAGVTGSICSGSSKSLSASGGVNYSWSPTTGVSNASISNPTFSPTSTTTYTVTVTDASGCTGTTTATITVNANPAAPTITVSANGDTLYAATGYSSYQWYKNSIPIGSATNYYLYIGTDSSDFTVVVTNASGCSNSSTSSNRSLPVELILFNAIYNGRTVDIDWSTSAEMNNDYFTVERTKDGIGFTSLLKLKGGGTTNRLLIYHAVDESPLFGISAYRLRQTDYDGKNQYSRTIAVNTRASSNLEILAFTKNANDNIFQFLISNPNHEAVNIRVIDALGRVMYASTSSENYGAIDFSDFVHGMYLLKIYTNDESAERKTVY